MTVNDTRPGLPKTLSAYIAAVCLAGAALLVYLVSGLEWSPSTLSEAGLFFVLVVAAGSFPLPVAPRVKADVSTAALFGAAILLEPGLAALAATVGVVSYTFLLRYSGDKLRLSRVPGSGVRGRGSGERETTASSLAQIHRRDDYAAAERAIGAREGDGPGTIWGRGGPVSVFSCRGETL